jgi:Uma2 family endonuclease
MSKIVDYPIRSKRGEPPYELATLYSPQGSWTLDEYLALDISKRVEFDNGTLEFLPMRTVQHQRIVAALYRLLFAFVDQAQIGEVLFAGLRVQTRKRKVREPDIVYMAGEHVDRCSQKVWQGADLVMEVVSEDDPERDYVKKRKEYAKAEIPEYWIVDPAEKKITVLALHDGKYAEHCVAGDGARAESALLKGFSVEVAKVFKK